MKKNLTINEVIKTLFFLALILIVSGCANKEVVTPCLTGHTYGL